MTVLIPGSPSPQTGPFWISVLAPSYACSNMAATLAVSRSGSHRACSSHDRAQRPGRRPRTVRHRPRHRLLGWIALHSGLGGGADVILLPEIPFTVEAIAGKILTREYRGCIFSIVICAEGAVEKGGGGQVYQESTGTLGGIGAHVATQVAKVTGKDARVVVLGHLQRGGGSRPRWTGSWPPGSGRPRSGSLPRAATARSWSAGGPGSPPCRWPRRPQDPHRPQELQMIQTARALGARLRRRGGPRRRARAAGVRPGVRPRAAWPSPRRPGRAGATGSRPGSCAWPAR